MVNFDEVDLYSGLAALHWSAYDDRSWDHDFYRRVVEEANGLALDVACGAGRLLRRYLHAGLAVEGVDSSVDMLGVCQRKAEAEGLAPILYCQPMQALELPKRYACIYVPCGSFTCVMGRNNALAALQRFHNHLEANGVLAFNSYLRDWGDYDYNEPDKVRVYPTEWKPHVTKELDGIRRLVIDRRLTEVDPVEQYTCEQRRYRLYEGDRLRQEEIHAGQNHWYFRNELLLMLQMVGFDNITVTGDYSDEVFGPQHSGTMVFLARKPA